MLNELLIIVVDATMNSRCAAV